MKIKQIAPVLAAFAVLAMPVVASAAANSANTTINATVNEVISITSVSPVTLSLTPTAGGVVSSASDTVTVATNRTTGYALTIKDSDATTTLTSGGNTIASNTSTTVADALANGEWGWAVNSTTTGVGVTGFNATYSAETNNTSSTSTWAGLEPTAGIARTIKTTSAASAGDVTTVWFAARVASAQPNGTYTDTVTYTATTN